MAKITWTNLGGGTFATGGNWSGGAAPGAADDVSITQAGAYTVTLSSPTTINSLLLADATGTLAVNSTLNVPGTVTLAAGTVALNSNGWLRNATVQLAGGTLLSSDGTLDHVTIDGTLALPASGERLYMANGAQFFDATGTLPGTVSITGNNSGLYAVANATFDAVAINIGSASGASLNDYDTIGGNSVLTLGSAATVTQVGAEAQFTSGYANGDAIVNQGHMLLTQTGGSFSTIGKMFSNAGSITAAGETVLFNSGSFTNTGSISATGGALTLQGVWTSSGAITTAGSVVTLAGTSDFGSAGNIIATGGTANLSGLLNGTGQTLGIGAGSNLGVVTLQYNGTIHGGTLLSTGSGVSLQGGTLDAVTYRGSLDLSATFSRVYLANGTAVTDASGLNPGVIVDSGSGSTLSLLGSTTLDAATVQIGHPSNAPFIAGVDPVGSNTTATLGASLVVQQTGLLAQLSSAYNPGDALLNLGTISATFAGGTLTTSGTKFANAGTIAVASGDSFISNAATLSNTGSISVGAGSTLKLGGVWSNAGSIAGTGAQIILAGTGNAAGLGNLSNTGLTSFSGTFDLQGTSLAIGAGSAVGATALVFPGMIRGGTLVDAGGSSMAMQSGTLDNVTYNGVLDISQPIGGLYFAHGLTLHDASGLLPGTINLTGNGASLYALSGPVLGDATLDNATLTIGNAAYYSYLVAYDGFSAGNSRLVLGSGFNIQHTGLFAQIYSGTAAGDGVTNTGRINAALPGGTMTTSGLSFANAGTIAVSNSDRFATGATNFSNIGQMSVTTGGSLQIGGTWTNTGLITETGGTLQLNGTTSFASFTGISRTGGAVNLSGYVEGNGGSLSIGGATPLGQLVLQTFATLHNGVLIDQGSGMTFQGGTLDNMTYRGVIDMSTPGATLHFVNALTLSDTAGTGPGQINLTGSGALLFGDNTTTLDNASLLIGNANGAQLQANDLNGGHSVMKLGTGLSITQAGLSATITNGYASADGVLNQGKIIAAQPGGLFWLTGHAFTNDTTGSIAVSSTDQLQVGAANFINLGSLAIASGGTVNLNTAWDNQSGTITETGGVLNLNGTGTFARLGTIKHTGGAVNIGGSIDGTGGTLAIGAGTNLGAVTLVSGGTIHGGLLLDSGSGLIGSNGTLDGVAYRGTLDLSGAGSGLALANTVSFANLAGTGPGAINLTGSSANLWEYGVNTLDNVNITIGSASADTIWASDIPGNIATLTLGANLHLTQTTGTAWLRTAYSANSKIINQGSIASSGAGAVMNVSGSGTFTNQGLLSVANNGSLNLTGIGFGNLAGGVLTGGTFSVGTGSTLQLANDLPVVTDAADITLSGTGSVWQSFKTATGLQTGLEATLATIAPGGALRVLGGRNYTAGVAMADNGRLQLGGGTLGLAASVNSFTVGAGGTLAGSGAVNFGAGKAALPLTNNGLIDAIGGKLVIAQSVSGTGNLRIESGSTLELTGAAAQPALFNGTGATLLLDQPASFTGTLAGFGAGELIDLAGLSVTGATISGGTMTVALAGGGSQSYAVAASSSVGALRVASDLQGGSLITGYQLAVAGQHTPEPVVFANAHVGDVLSQALTLGNIVSPGTGSEFLNASLGTGTGAATASGAFTGLAPGASDSTSLVIGLNTAADGLRSGTATISLASDGTGVAGDGFGPVGIGSQLVTVAGAVYAFANPIPSAASVAIPTVRVGDAAPVGVLTLAGGTAADAYQESLVYAAEPPGGNFTLLSGGSGTIASGGSAVLSLGGQSSQSGTYGGSLVLDLTSTGAGTSGLADTVLPSQTIAVTGKVYQPAVADVFTSSVNFGAVHTGSVANGTVALHNGGYGNLADTLTGGFGAISAPFSGGSLGAGLASGAAGLLGVSFAPLTGGVYSGSAALNLASHNPDMPDLPLAAAPVTLSGTAWDYAAAHLSSTVLNLGSVRVGAPAATQTLTLSNGTQASAFQESLYYVMANQSPQTVTLSGPVSDTIVSGDTRQITVTLNTAVAGGASGASLILQPTSTGSGTSGLGTTVQASQTVSVNGKVYAPASASVTPGPYTFNAHVGDVPSALLQVSNIASGALIDHLTGGFGTITGPWQGAGALDVAGGASGALSLTMSTAAEGIFSGSATFVLQSHDADLSDIAAPLAPVTLGGTVYAYASPKLGATALNFGTMRLGAAAAPQTVTSSNGSAADAYREDLRYGVEQPTGFNIAGGAAATLAAGNSSAVSLSINAATAGAYAGTPMVIDVWSEGAAGSGFGETKLANQQVALTGKVYAPAKAQPAVSGIGFGIVHVGDVVSQSVQISNAASGALTDLLTGGWGTVTGAFSGSGTLGTGITAGAAGSLTVTLNTAASGTFSGTGALSLASHDTDLTDLPLSVPTLSFTATVDNLAAGAFKKMSGAGSWGGGGTNYTLALGTVPYGSGTLTTTVAAFNGAAGLADLLSGTVTASGDTAFSVSGLNAFSNISNAQLGCLPVITLSAAQSGNFTEKLVITGNGSNASGYNAPVQAVTLTVTGSVAPQPTVWTLTQTPTNITASTADDTFNASNGVLYSGDQIDGGGGTNALVLNGYGQFDLSKPAKLTNIQIVKATEGQNSYTPPGGTMIPSQVQTITLRAGLDLTVNVAADPAMNAANPAKPTIVIIGADNNDVINLATGNDIVTLGGIGETVNGGGGNNVFNVTASTIGAHINGGVGKNTLAVSGGGTVTMGSSIAQISTVTLGLTTGSAAYNFTANAIAGMAILDNTAGTNTIPLGAATQSVNMNGAKDKVKASAAFASALIKGGAAGASLEITSGGTIALNAGTTVSSVQLDAASKLKLSNTIGQSAIGSSGADTITASAQSQILSGGGGIDTLIASLSHGDIFRDLTANLTGDIIQGFGGSGSTLDKIDFTDMAYSAGMKWNFTGGKLTATDGVHPASVGVAGTLTKANFTLSGDGAGGTLFTFHV